jgi:hypothetical protein
MAGLDSIKTKAINIKISFMALSTPMKIVAVAVAVAAIVSTGCALAFTSVVTLAAAGIALFIKVGTMIHHHVKKKKEENAGETNSASTPKETLLQKLKTIDDKLKTIGTNIKTNWKNLLTFKKFAYGAAIALAGVVTLVALSFHPVVIVSALITVILIAGAFVYLGFEHKLEEEAPTLTVGQGSVLNPTTFA